MARMAGRGVKGKMPMWLVGIEWEPRKILPFRSRKSNRRDSAGWLGRSATLSSRQKQPIRGFTLVEILLVMTIIGVVISLALPSIGPGLNTLQLQTTARQVAAALRQTRYKAIREQKPYWLTFDLEFNRLDLLDEGGQYHRSFEFPEGVYLKKVTRLREKTEEEKTKYGFSFLPNGMSPSFEVLLSNRRGREMKVVNDAWTRSPTIEEVEN